MRQGLNSGKGSEAGAEPWVGILLLEVVMNLRWWGSFSLKLNNLRFFCRVFALFEPWKIFVKFWSSLSDLSHSFLKRWFWSLVLWNDWLRSLLCLSWGFRIIFTPPRWIYPRVKLSRLRSSSAFLFVQEGWFAVWLSQSICLDKIFLSKSRSQITTVWCCIFGSKLVCWLRFRWLIGRCLRSDLDR